jgi:hypothetical protein
MQITSNTTGMPADLSVVTDNQARDHCVVVIKGTFETRRSGDLGLADQQRPLTMADEHYGDPATTCVRYECDFAAEKPFTDVIVVGKAMAPRGQRVKQLLVSLEVQGRRKDLRVVGDRRWVSGLRPFASEPEAFTEMPVTFDRAWGGTDDSRGPGRAEVEPRNLSGVGFHPRRPTAQIAGLPVPNIEAPDDPVTSPRGRYTPVGLGCVGRAWQPRVAHAGTYDERWRADEAPFLPADFDPRYFQCASEDQQFPHFQGGEVLRCLHMAEAEVVTYVIPRLEVPVLFRFAHGDVDRTAILDTVTLEPHLGIATLVHRASAPLEKKLTALREIKVGKAVALPVPSHGDIRGYRNGKPIFRGIAASLRWLKQRRSGP